MYPLSMTCLNALGFIPLLINLIFTPFFKYSNPLLKKLTIPYYKKKKKLRSDGRGEFVNHSLQSYLQKYGIIHKKILPLYPEQNGVAERKHRHIVQVALTLMSKASIPIKF